MADNQSDPGTVQAYLANDRVDNITSVSQAETQIHNYEASAAQDKAIMDSAASSGTEVRSATARYNAAEFDIQQVQGAENELKIEQQAAAQGSGASASQPTTPNENPNAPGAGTTSTGTSFVSQDPTTQASAASTSQPATPNENPNAPGAGTTSTGGTGILGDPGSSHASPASMSAPNQNPSAPGFGTTSTGATGILPTPAEATAAAATPANVEGGVGHQELGVSGVGLKSHTVQAGENLSEIAKSEGVALSALEEANKQIPDFNTIYPGQHINVPTAGSTGSDASAGGNLGVGTGHTEAPEEVIMKGLKSGNGSFITKLFRK